MSSTGSEKSPPRNTRRRSISERLGLPYSPSSKPPARRVDKAGPPKVLLGQAFADYEVHRPTQVIMHTGETRYVPARRG